VIYRLTFVRLKIRDAAPSLLHGHFQNARELREGGMVYKAQQTLADGAFSRYSVAIALTSTWELGIVQMEGYEAFGEFLGLQIGC